MIAYTAFTKRFGRLIAVDALDLAVRPGETLALVGPNGSGKTTTLKAALGLVRPTAGAVRVAGVDATVDGRRARQRLGYVPQRLSFAEGSTAREVVRFFARVRGAPMEAGDRLLERVGLADAATRPAESFSGGMKQRLGIALALLGAPDALILDEPTAALDPTGSLAVRDLVGEIAGGGTTVVISSHDLAEVSALADRVAVFVGGRLEALGTPDELVASLGLPARMQIGIDGWVPDPRESAERAGARALAWEAGVLRCEVVPGREAEVLEALRSAGSAVTSVTVRAPVMEDIYRAATDGSRRVA